MQLHFLLPFLFRRHPGPDVKAFELEYSSRQTLWICCQPVSRTVFQPLSAILQLLVLVPCPPGCSDHLFIHSTYASWGYQVSDLGLD